MSRPLLVALLIVLALMVGSWMLGELLRQRLPKGAKETQGAKATPGAKAPPARGQRR